MNVIGPACLGDPRKPMDWLPLGQINTLNSIGLARGEACGWADSEWDLG